MPLVHARRNRSLTKEEVEAFWKQRRRSGEESPFGSLEKAAGSPPGGGSSSTKAGASSSPRVRVDGFGHDDGGAADSPSKSRDWWTRSSWAFLNEPPQEEPPSGRAHSYTPQFHVATSCDASLSH